MEFLQVLLHSLNIFAAILMSFVSFAIRHNLGFYANKQSMTQVKSAPHLPILAPSSTITE